MEMYNEMEHLKELIRQHPGNLPYSQDNSDLNPCMFLPLLIFATSSSLTAIYQKSKCRNIELPMLLYKQIFQMSCVTPYRKTPWEHLPYMDTVDQQGGSSVSFQKQLRGIHMRAAPTKLTTQ